MTAHHHLASVDPSAANLCYFSIVPAAHFSLETPSSSPVSEYQACTPSDPTHPLLALRPLPPLFMSGSQDASRLLQLQTDAAYRPSPGPLQPQARASSASSNSSDSATSSASSSSYTSPATLSCCRCRRQCLANMYQIGTNRYYCSHCARMTGYSAG